MTAMRCRADTMLVERGLFESRAKAQAAIAAGLAKGLPLVQAAQEAKAYVSAVIGAADRLDVGSGRGPLHHFHAWC